MNAKKRKTVKKKAKKEASKKTAKNKASKKAAPKKSFEKSLWDTANKLRGKVESSGYKHIGLGLIFVEFVSDRLELRRQEFIDKGNRAESQYRHAFV